MKNSIRIAIAIATAASLGGGFYAWHNAQASAVTSWRYAAVEQGSLRSTVSATGTLNAVRTVEVGTQVSGQIAAINVDFNDHVKKGQLIARIDPTLQQQAVQDAQAGVAKADAQLTQAKLEYERNVSLHDAKIVTESEFNVTQVNYAVAKSNRTSAQISLDKARQNLAYTNIHAPIDGVVIERAMDVGQTVAASLSAPKLFVIANDLSQMEILASVDESDIGKIQEGQAVSFTVQSFQDRGFRGTVRQVRLSSTTANNVVSYTAVIAVDNKDGKLLPGMTATVKFVTGSASDVLTVANTALRFAPPAVTTAPKATTPPAAGPQGGQQRGSRAGAVKSGTLYTMEKGALVAHKVTLGLTDGSKTQVSGEGIAAGLQVVVGSGTGTAGATASAAASSNPFQQQPSGARRAPGPF
ncbi:MAG: putative macrolide-specific efflux protein [Gemmatimonadetes bacterium]|nr:putative macrolide-specific efflux protein [Gemmatimonadota bacterium]